MYEQLCVLIILDDFLRDKHEWEQKLVAVTGQIGFNVNL